MFVLEKLLRNFSDAEATKTRLTPSIYDEMINEIEEWRNQPIVSEEYHEVVRDLVSLYHTKLCVEDETDFAAVFEGIHQKSTVSSGC